MSENPVNPTSNIMTLILNSVQTSCSPHLAYSESLIRQVWSECVPTGDMISFKFQGVTFHHICEYFETNRPIGELCSHNTFCARNRALGRIQTRNSQGAPDFRAKIFVKSVGQILRIVAPLRMCIFGADRWFVRLTYLFFLKSHWHAVKVYR